MQRTHKADSFSSLTMIVLTGAKYRLERARAGRYHWRGRCVLARRAVCLVRWGAVVWHATMLDEELGDASRVCSRRQCDGDMSRCRGVAFRGLVKQHHAGIHIQDVLGMIARSC